LQTEVVEKGNSPMRVAITASGPTLDANVDPRFGRCAYFLIVDTGTLSFEAVENPNVLLGHGAGIQSAQLMVCKDVKFVLTGNCGPNAHETLSAAGISVILGSSGVVRDAVARFKAGQFDIATEANVGGHSGMADAPSSFADQRTVGDGPRASRSPGPGGAGRGVGRGIGKGMGRDRESAHGRSGGGLAQGRRRNGGTSH
jgi:predicted Fe-Mo cluster-binding NifX family protein